MDLIYKMVNEHQKLLIRSEIVVKKLNCYSFSPNNTTDYYGFVRLFYICSQLFYEVDVISQDILNSNLDKSQSFDKLKYNKVEEYLDSVVQEYLYEPKNRNLLSLSCLDHMAFLEYYHQTHKEVKYVTQSKAN